MLLPLEPGHLAVVRMHCPVVEKVIAVLVSGLVPVKFFQIAMIRLRNGD